MAALLRFLMFGVRPGRRAVVRRRYPGGNQAHPESYTAQIRRYVRRHELEPLP